MAGLLPKIVSQQKPYVSGYTLSLLEKAEAVHGRESGAYKGIFNQYFRMPQVELRNSLNARHYEAEMSAQFPKGLERLYRRVVVVDLLTACASECVYCLRGYYQPFTLTSPQIANVAEYLANTPELRETLITGGDPFVSAKKLKQMIKAIVETAPNIKVVRIGTRLPVQSPDKFDRSLFGFFHEVSDRIGIEVGCQINHPFELQTDARRILDELQRSGCRVYSQNVLLRGVNDRLDTLLELYDELRYLGVIPHYLFHAIPLKGTDEFRTSVDAGIELISDLSSRGEISGLAKPMYALMTDIGKVTLYEDSIQGRENGRILVKTGYRLDKRRIWNPDYQIPDTAVENEDGTLSVYYLDGQI